MGDINKGFNIACGVLIAIGIVLVICFVLSASLGDAIAKSTTFTVTPVSK